MNIAFFISSLKFGGAEKQTVMDANSLSVQMQVYLIYFEKGELEEQISSNVHLVQIKKTNYLETAIRLNKVIKKNNVKIIHSSLFAAMIISAISSFFINRISVIWHFHSHEYELPWFHKGLYKYFARLSRVKKIVFVNKELINYFQEGNFCFPKSKIQLLYNSSTFNVTTDNKLGKKLLIGYIGRFVPLKRVEYFIELAQDLNKKSISNYQIILVGDGPQRTVIEQKILESGLSDYFSFTGFINDVGSFYSMFDIFINPSQEECLSISLIDAAMFGIPSIAFNAGGNNEIIIDGLTGFVVENKEEMITKTKILLGDKSLREKMGLRAKEHCLRNFSIDRHLDQLKAIYKDISND